VPDRLGEAAGEVDLGDLGAALPADPCLGADSAPGGGANHSAADNRRTPVTLGTRWIHTLGVVERAHSLAHFLLEINRC
jgi:hypothetical protein